MFLVDQSMLLLVAVLSSPRRPLATPTVLHGNATTSTSDTTRSNHHNHNRWIMSDDSSLDTPVACNIDDDDDDVRLSIKSSCWSDAVGDAVVAAASPLLSRLLNIHSVEAPASPPILKTPVSTVAAPPGLAIVDWPFSFFH